MADIDELQRRLAAALDRIAQGVDTLGAKGGDGGPDTGLQAALEEERSANAQLEARVQALKEKQETQVSALEDEAARLRDKLAELDTELQRLRQASEELRASNEEMREALQKELGEPQLVNKAMLAELETLRALRAAEAAEAQGVYDLLSPILARAGGDETKDDADAPEDEEAR